MFGMDEQTMRRRKESAQRRVWDLSMKVHSLEQELKKARRELEEMEQLANWQPMTAARAAAEAATGPHRASKRNG